MQIIVNSNTKIRRYEKTCKFFQKGKCKYGQRCKFTHISETQRSNNNKNLQEGAMEKRMDQLEKMVRSFFLPHQPPNLLRAPIPQVPTKQVPIIQGFAQGIPPMYHQVPYVPYETQRNM